MVTSEAVEVVVKVMAPYIGDTMHLDPFVHATFVLAYGLVAGGAHRQLRLLRS
jgi:hypothetical protein